MNTIKKFLKDESGLELSEYAIAAAIVALLAAGVFTALSSAISTKIQTLTNKISGGNP